MMTSTNVEGMEPWRQELYLAIRDPAGYSEVLQEVEPRDLFISLHMLNRALSVARLHPGLLVAIDVNDDLIACLEDLSSRMQTELARRGLTIPETEMVVMQ